MPFHTLVQPGPVYPERRICKIGKLHKVEIPLKKGDVLIEAISGVLEPLGIRGAGIRFHNLKLFPMKYVMPTYASDDTHVAYYSETYTAEEETHIYYGNATYGIRENVPFMHFHGLWKKDGKTCGGHIHAFASVVAEDTYVTSYGTTSVEMNSLADTETNFTVFQPEYMKKETVKIGDEICMTAVIKPNEDLLTAINELCDQYGIGEAVIQSGVGSTVGGIFEDGNVVEEIPTELIVMDGKIRVDAQNKHHVDFDTVLIDASGMIHRGILSKNENPVLILFELFITGRKVK